MAFRAQLLAWPAMRATGEKGNQELEAFNVQLQLCQDVKLSGTSLAELDSPATLLHLASKLPSKLQLGWQTKAFDLETKEQREATFTDFVKFVERQAGLRNHPVYSQLSADNKKAVKVAMVETKGQEDSAVVTAATANKMPPNKTPSTTKKGSSTTEVTPPNAFAALCLMCKGQHATADCRDTEVSKKERYEKLRGLCFGCLRPGHLARQCENRAQCKVCGDKHPTVLHSTKTTRVGAETKGELGSTASKANSKGNEKAMATRGEGSLAVATVPVKVWVARAEPVVVNAILDPASTATFVIGDLAGKLGVKPQMTSIGVTTIRAEEDVAVGVIHDLHVSDLDGNQPFSMPVAYAVQSLPFSTVPGSEDVGKWNHLREVPFRWAPEAPVAMLIGLNVAGALRPEEVVSGGLEEPYAVRTPLGWAVHGALGKDDPPSNAKVMWTRTTKNVKDGIRESLDRLHYSDFENALDFSRRGPSKEDKEWQHIVDISAARVPDAWKAGQFQYVIDLPFKAGAAAALRDNFDQAMARMASLKRKFACNVKFHEDYKAFMTKMVTNGYVEEVNRASTDSSPVSYVPHHGVYHPKKPDKIRVVFNCANKFQGVALNDCLLQGPDLTNSLVGVLIRFRQYPIAFMADIESMFYRVQVPPHQRDALRFLWWKGEEREPSVFRMKVHLFGATSSPSVANYALRRAAQEAQEGGVVSMEVREAVQRNFYVDDCLKSMQTEEEALEMARGLITACAYGGFRLTKFVSTSRALLQGLPCSERAKDFQEHVALDENKADPLGALQERALGVAWSLGSDCFTFKVSEVMAQEPAKLSKRIVLSKLSALYDPLGIAAPVVIVARILFRELTQSKQGWDDELEQTAAARWRVWQKGLGELQNVSVPRCLFEEPEGEIELHVFCDASADAYGAVAYLRRAREGLKEAEVRFIMGKARVSPPKVVTIPRLELTAAKLATEVAQIVSKEVDLQISRRVFWSDSMTVLKYLRNATKRFHVFVANRVGAILAASREDEWHYVPTAANPADEATRGLEAQRLASSAWLTGPAFLRSEETGWPSSPELSLSPTDPELQQKVEVAHTCTSSAKNMGHATGNVVEMLAERYSSIHKVRQLVASWLRVKAWLRKKLSTWEPKFSISELQEADKEAIACLQTSSWREDMQILKAQKQLAHRSPLFKLNPAMRGSVLVMQSRARVNLTIVPPGAYATLLVQEAHERQGHQGRAITAAGVLRQYWVVGLNKTVRKVVRSCPSCQRRRARPQNTAMAPLPAYRCQPTVKWPFQVTGVDYFGPFYVKRARSRIKAYGVIFTCALMRAVHLEVAQDLSGPSFINALRRFVARRGHVTKFVSDNGTNFVGAQTLLHEEVKKMQASSLAERHLRTLGIEWTFNPPGASHHSGFWERLIQSVRRILEALMARHTLTYESLTTVMCEAEAIMNNRPLTTVSEDPNDLNPLTPNHLLIGRDGSNALPGDYDSTAEALRHSWKHVQFVTNEFWRRWNNEYRVLLHQRPKWHRAALRNLLINDPVLVMDPLVPREQWRLGRVVAVHRNEKDQEVRAADVKTKQGLLTRPITKLCLLEAASENKC